MRLRNYGLGVFRGGLVLRSDGRKWLQSPWGWWYAVVKRHLTRPRGPVTGLSSTSRKGLEFLAASVACEFRSHVTLTYHAKGESWDDAERNKRIALRSKDDLNRFLASVRKSIGRYLWVQEFQERGVVHFHLLCEAEIQVERLRLVWCRATDELHDPDALRHAVRVQSVRSQVGARSYVSRYAARTG